MKQFDELYQLTDFLQSVHIYLSGQQISKLQSYLSELIEFSKKHRIVSTNDINYIVSRHFLSSFYFVKNIKDVISENDNILDLGSGAGFPGIILSICFSNRVVLTDSIRKKTIFLKKIIKQLNLNCEVIHDRIEQIKYYEKREFKIITARALASINDLFELTNPFIKKGVLHTIKGLNFEDEISGNKNKISLSFKRIDDSWIKYSHYLMNKVYITFTAPE